MKNNMTMYTPVGRHILVRAEETTTTTGGLILPGAGNAAGPTGARISLVVIEAGPRCEEKYRVGDVLIVSSGQVTEVRGEPGDEKKYFVHETQVVGIRRDVDLDELPF